jgi:hypothetical protein
MKKLISLMMLFSSIGFAEIQFGGVLAATNSPVQMSAANYSSSIDTTMVQRIAIRVVPGYCGKIYIGTSGMNISTLTNVIKILYPNCNGGLSDEYVLQDVTGNDGINSTTFYVAGQNTGDNYLIEFNQTGLTGAKNLVPVQVGILTNWNSNDTWLKAAGNSNVAVLQFNIIPGGTGKFWVMGPYGNEKVLYPNNGTVTGNITDKYELYGFTQNGLVITSNGYLIEEGVSGESLVVGVWMYQ